MTTWTKIKISVSILAILIISGLVLYSRSLANTNSTLSQTNQQLQANVTSLEASLVANTQALLVREVTIARLSEEQELTLSEMEVIYETNEDAADWGNTNIPDAIYNSLLK